MADVNINKFRASVVRDGSKPASPGFIVSEGQDPVDPAGNGQNHLPVTIATAATGLSITDSQVLGGAGTVGQYIRGDGSLADFPQASGGGSSVSYYLNGSISQGTIGGVAYKELNKVPILGAGTDFTINADGYIASFLTDAGDPNLLEIPGGNWNFETYFSASSSGGSPSFYVELYKYDGTTFTLIASSSSSPELIAFGTNLNPYFSTLAVPTTTLALTDRLAIRYYVTHSGRTITLHTENNHLCQVVTTFTTGLTSLNGLTAQVQNLAVGTSGTDFNIASATATHTFNLPTASATNRGALSSADWTTFNNKQNALTNPVTGTGASGQVAYFTGTTAISSESNLFWDATNDRLGIGTATPSAKLEVNGTLSVLGDFAQTGNFVVTNRNFELFLQTDTAKDIIFRPATVEQMRIFSGGNLHIGPTPASNNGARLQVTGTAIFTSSITASSIIRSGGTSSQYLMADGSVSTLTNPVTGTGVSGRVAYWNGTNSITSDSDLLFDGSNLTVGGNVLVGSNQIIGINTADASDTGYLAICGASSDGPDRAGHIYLSGNERGTDAGSVVIAGGNTTSGTGATAAIVFRTLGTNKARLTSAGNFGLGTETPVTFGTRNLDVNGGAGSAYIVARGFNNAGTVEMAFDGSGYIGTKTAHDLVIRTSDLQRINIFATSGNVLVGGSGSDNGARLQVSGTARISGNLTLETSSLILGLGNGGSNEAVYFNYNSNAASRSWRIIKDWTAFGDFQIQQSTTQTGTTYADILRFSPAGAATFSGDLIINSLNPIAYCNATSNNRASGIITQESGTSKWAFGTNFGTGDNSFNVYNYAAGSRYLTITSGGNVLIGTATDSGSKLRVNGDIDISSTSTSAPNLGTGVFLRVGSSASNFNGITFQGNFATDMYFGRAVGSDDLVIRSNTGEKVKFTAGGKVFINSTDVSTQGEMFFVTATNLAAMFRTTGGAANNWAANFWNNATSGNNLFIEFGTETGFTGRGSVTYNRGSGVVAYNTTSDYRIKTEIQDFNAFDIINNLKPKKFKIGDAKQKSIGFIAHELQEFFPQAVHGEKDAIDSNNKPIYQGVDYSQLTGLLVKAIQELKQEIDNLKN